MPTINFAGIASGIDSNALIEALSQATRSTRVVPLEQRVTKFQDTSSALTDLKSKFSTLKDLLGDFTTLRGGALTKQMVSTNETYVSGTASNAATNGTYDITVTARAKNATFSFDDRFASQTSVLNSSISDIAPEVDRTVTFSLGTTTPQTVSVVLTSTSTLSDFVSSFNSNSSNTRATASIVNVGTTASPSYAVVINSTSTGLAEGNISLTSTGSELAAGSGVFQANSLDQATNASFTMTGVDGAITRSTNTVSDVVPGVTFTLNGLGNAKLTVTDDVAATTGKVQDWVDAYNEIVTFLADNNQITREEDGENIENIFAPLSLERSDDNALSNLRSALSASGYSGGSEIRIFADLGITTQRDGTLKFDQSVFKTAMASEPTSVNSVMKAFADTTALTNGTIDQFIRFNGIFDTVINGNNDLIRNLNEQISQAEAGITRQEDLLRQQYARLESLMGRLQNQQSSLSSALAGLR